MNNCYINNCPNDVGYFCICSSNIIFICSEHVIQHLQGQGEHRISSIAKIRLDDISYQKITLKARKIISNLNKIKTEILNNAIILRDKIERATNKSLNRIREIERNLCKLCKRSNDKEDLNKLLYEKVINFEVQECNIDLQMFEDIKNNMQSFFERHYIQNLMVDDNTDNKIIYFDSTGSTTMHLLSFDEQDKVTSSTRNISQALNYYNQYCKLPTGKYFINGGRDNDGT